MKIVTKPIRLIDRPNLPLNAFETLVAAHKPQAKTRAYQQLVTSQGVHPDRAMALLGLRK